MYNVESPHSTNSLPMMDELAKRSVRFIQRWLASDSSLVKSVANNDIYVGRMHSPIGRNVHNIGYGITTLYYI